MAQFYLALTPELRSFLARQHMFFVASAPLDAAGRVNLSPKGMDTFRVLADDEVAYLDLTGSGNETAAHLRENGRLTLMFCAFHDKPLILRLYGKGEAIRPRDAEWDELLSRSAGSAPNHPHANRVGANVLRLRGAPVRLRRSS
jgi:hypothetical protein